MLPVSPCSSDHLAALVQRVDEHADRHLPLVERALSLLGGSARPPPQERFQLADALERWRYQLLNERSARLTAAERRLVDALDLLAASVRDGLSRPPKHLRAWLQQPTAPPPMEWALDPAIPLEEVAEAARATTRRNFAAAWQFPAANSRYWRMRLYAPLYVSSYCVNYCAYCHFRFPNQLQREHLDKHAALAQADFLAHRGFRHILVVAGDFPRLTSTNYFAEIVRALADRGFVVAVEVAPQSTAGYARLVAAGASGVTLYQETYQEAAYARYHPRGTKAWFDWRLEALERAAEAGITRLGLGILLGLAPAQADLGALAAHGRYLESRFPYASLAFSLPRLHDAPRPFVPPCPVDDDTLVRLYCALRLSFPTAELTLSTRERPELRNRLASICITQMSAESCTSPGGYGAPHFDVSSRRQFPVQDERTAAEVAQWLHSAGFHVAFKD